LCGVEGDVDHRVGIAAIGIKIGVIIGEPFDIGGPCGRGYAAKTILSQFAVGRPAGMPNIIVIPVAAASIIPRKIVASRQDKRQAEHQDHQYGKTSSETHCKPPI
jgi:hypothetical protein